MTHANTLNVLSSSRTQAASPGTQGNRGRLSILSLQTAINRLLAIVEREELIVRELDCLLAVAAAVVVVGKAGRLCGVLRGAQ